MHQPAPVSQTLIFWFIWASLLAGVVVYPFFLGDGIPTGPNAAGGISPGIWALAGGSLLIAGIIRWIVLPRIKEIQMQMAPFVIGIAIAEAIVFYGLFLVPSEYPQTQLIFFILSFIGVAQFIPTFTRANRFDPHAEHAVGS